MKKFISFYLIIVLIFALSGREALCAQTVSENMPRDFQSEKAKAFILSNIEATEELMQQASAVLREGKIGEAIGFYESAIELAPYDFRPYSFLAELYLRTDRDDDFFKILEKSMRTKTHYDLIFQNIEEVKTEIKKPPETPKPSSLISIAQFKDNTQAAVCFLFDDGSKIVYTRVLPIFEEFGFKATIPINPGLVPPVSHIASPGTWDECRDAAKRGFEIANHTMTHRHLKDVPEEVLESEINESQELIAREIGKRPLSFAFPFDYADPDIVEKVAEQHLAIRDHDHLKKTYKNVFIPVYGGAYFSVLTAKRVVDLALERNLWLVVECHTLKTETHTFKPITEEFLRSHLLYLKENKDKIWVDTFINIYLYLAEKKGTEIKIEDSRPKEIAFRLVNSLNPDIYSAPLTVVINTAPLKPKKAWATQGKKARRLDVKIDEEKIYVNAVPGQGVVRVRWK